MGQKTNPIGLRLRIIKNWDSVWFADRDYADKLHQDLRIKSLVKSSLSNAGVSKVVIRRSASKKINIEIFAARPGMVIGKKGSDIEKLKGHIEKITGCETSINIQEIRKPEIEAKLVAENIAQQLEKRVAFRKASKRAVQTSMKMGAKGIRVNVSGRLGGAEIARMEWYREGRVPLHTLRADIDYATAEAKTTYGIIGVKVWIYKGDVGIESPLEKEVKAVN
ncbi:MAG: 30S ribosomal protein S3 [Candidatus Jidaibacter sp.]|jgi:small subunit ribosomal protein S3|nr:30S ribosomal protein S3 [Candidatus Jidaibacter sp.]